MKKPTVEDFRPYEHGKKDIRHYKIMRPNATHTRLEKRDDKIVPVTYAGNKPDCPNIIRLTPAGAKALAHMSLLEVGSGAVPSARPQLSGNRDIMIPEDWQELPAKDVKALARLITDGEVRTADLARDIIGEYLEEQAGDDQPTGGGDGEPSDGDDE